MIDVMRDIGASITTLRARHWRGGESTGGPGGREPSSSELSGTSMSIYSLRSGGGWMVEVT